MGKLFRPLIFILVFLIIITTETIRQHLGYEPLLPNELPIALLYVLMFITLISIIVIFYIRHKTNKKHEKIIESENISVNLKLQKDEFFYQSPLYQTDQQNILIYGFEENLTYSLYFNNNFERWLAIIIPLPIYGIHLQSQKHDIKIKSDKIVSLRFHYSVYIDNKYFGKFSNHKITSKKGITQLLPFYIKTEENNYDIDNPYGELTANIIKNKKEKILEGKRNFFDFKKSQETNLRGEQHKIKLLKNTTEPKELWLAFYVLAIVLKNNTKN